MFKISSIALLAAVIATATPASAADATTDYASVADYLIVGGGPAGLVLAEQLSRSGKKQVVLLEAGPDEQNSSVVNIPAEYLLIAEPYWNYTAQPDPNLNGNAPYLAQGRTYGGGTAVNGMAYCRGASSLFDSWATSSGNPGLAWKSMLQEFLEVSHYAATPNINYPQVVNTSVYGNGPIEVSRASELTGFEFPFAKAMESVLNLQEVDMTDGTGIGVDLGLSSITAVNRTRSYARTGYVPTLQKRSNVKLLPNSWVSKINFSGKTATSVTYYATGSKTAKTISAKEIIVSGGAINTPKLLLLSGVGPKDQLTKLKIPVVADIADVGQNLRDHAFAIIELQVTSDISTVYQVFLNATESAIAVQEYTKDASGPLGNNNGFTYGAFRLPDSTWDGVNGTHYTTLPADRPQFLMEFATTPFLNTNTSAITAWTSLVQPESFGSVGIPSTNYLDDPLIYTNYYGSPADKTAIIAGYKQLIAVLGQESVKNKTVGLVYPTAIPTTDAQIWAAIQNGTYTFHHPVGTVAIGKALNSNWRLNGLKGIRVVDSSTFPYPTTCHPQAVLYALANRAAKDIIKADS